MCSNDQNWKCWVALLQSTCIHWNVGVSLISLARNKANVGSYGTQSSSTAIIACSMNNALLATIPVVEDWERCYNLVSLSRNKTNVSSYGTNVGWCVWTHCAQAIKYWGPSCQTLRPKLCSCTGRIPHVDIVGSVTEWIAKNLWGRVK